MKTKLLKNLAIFGLIIFISAISLHAFNFGSGDKSGYYDEVGGETMELGGETQETGGETQELGGEYSTNEEENTGNVNQEEGGNQQEGFETQTTGIEGKYDTRGLLTSQDYFHLQTWMDYPEPRFVIGIGNGYNGFSYTWLSGYKYDLNLLPERKGNLGIGLSNPRHKLHLSVGEEGYLALEQSGGGKAGIKFQVDTEDSAAIIYNPDDGQLQISAGENQPVIRANNNGSLQLGKEGNITVTADGRVGIGIADPPSAFAVAGVITTSNVIVSQSNWPDYTMKTTPCLL